jgi:hypothetical protein
MNTQDVKRKFLESGIALGGEYLADLLDCNAPRNEIVDAVDQLASYIRRAGFKTYTNGEMLKMARQVPMPRSLIVDGQETPFEEWLLEQDSAIEVSWVEDLYHKCLAFGLEVSPVTLYRIWSDYYDLISSQSTKGNKNA